MSKMIKLQSVSEEAMRIHIINDITGVSFDSQYASLTLHTWWSHSWSRWLTSHIKPVQISQDQNGFNQNIYRQVYIIIIPFSHSHWVSVTVNSEHTRPSAPLNGYQVFTTQQQQKYCSSALSLLPWCQSITLCTAAIQRYKYILQLYEDQSVTLKRPGATPPYSTDSLCCQQSRPDLQACSCTHTHPSHPAPQVQSLPVWHKWQGHQQCIEARKTGWNSQANKAGC